jgi:hypothetical protein
MTGWVYSWGRPLLRDLRIVTQSILAEAPLNNGMHPTANSAAFIRET